MGAAELLALAEAGDWAEFFALCPDSGNPDGAEGQALMEFLRASGIPFSAFRMAIPGTATGPHIHIGQPSHRY